MPDDEIKTLILDTVADLVADFLYFDRKEDEDLPRDAIHDAVKNGEITVGEIIDRFSEELRANLRDDG